jgi:hypothetical protein
MESALRRVRGAPHHEQEFMELAHFAPYHIRATTVADRLTRACAGVDSRAIMERVDHEMLLGSTKWAVRTFTKLPKNEPLVHNYFLLFAQGINRKLHVQDCREPDIGVQSLSVEHRFAVATAAQGNLART